MKKPNPSVELTVTRVFPSPVDVVWTYFTDPEKIARWWGPEHFVSPGCRTDFREGGTYLFAMKAPDFLGGKLSYSAGTYTRIVEFERIEIIDYLADADGNRLDPQSAGLPPDFPHETKQVILFREIGGQFCEVALTQHGWQEGPMSEFCVIGVHQSFDKLSEEIRKDAAAPQAVETSA